MNARKLFDSSVRLLLAGIRAATPQRTAARCADHNDPGQTPDPYLRYRGEKLHFTLEQLDRNTKHRLHFTLLDQGRSI